MAADRAFAGQLGLKPGIRCWFHDLPDALRARLDADALGIEEQPTASDGLQCALLCVEDIETLRRQLTAVAPLLATNAFLWIVRAGDVAQHAATIADLADPVNLVVAETCRFDDKWSGVKLTAR
ncbi:hypothetical protein [Sphingomonas sp. S2-65]|uniref:hypothetical protein n=1 Tax=Sphingomonas sp. S2-65 TaxID=2903960 RepID=UPI001F33D29B|nr:hypothetical protein [Sphingomonas sp. S2-65]UYY58453.1 hypothetical protein LZ586_17655 [Sphingomonas sp. S2-65]